MPPTQPLAGRIRALTDAFVTDITEVIRGAALKAVEEALGTMEAELTPDRARRAKPRRLQARPQVEVIKPPASDRALAGPEDPEYPTVHVEVQESEVVDHGLISVRVVEPNTNETKAATKAAPSRRPAPYLGDAWIPRSVPRPPQKLHKPLSALLPDAIVAHLAGHPNLRTEELAQALDTEPADVKRALGGLRAEGRVSTSGKARGMRYSVALDGVAAATAAQTGEAALEPAEATAAPAE